MSWLLNLYETYEANLEQVGVIKTKHNGQEFTLLPISHTTQNAHIEVLLTEDGEFHSATVIDKSDANTIIPCTEDSANRAGSKVAPYPLHDKLSYVAGDFREYSKGAKGDEPFLAYIQQLEEWTSSTYTNAKVKSIYTYLSERRLIQDLVKEGILYVDADNYLISKWDKKYEALCGGKPEIFSAISSEQESAFVRFTIYSPNDVITKVWRDKDVYESFISFYREKLGDKDICYVTGRELPRTNKHANKIRHSADKAKLISANDTSGFTFRGRFNESDEVASISYEVSQKAHNALKWLINRQGKMISERVFLIWSNDIPSIPNATDSTWDISVGVMDTKPKVAYTNAEFANEFVKALDGYKHNLSSKADVNILILDSATTGRLAVLYYRNMNKELYIEKLIHWHSTCRWRHQYEKNQAGEYIDFEGSPATKDIAFAAYGANASDKVVKGLVERILPCIVEGREIPKDIIRSAIHRASNPVSMEQWEWKKTLSITCALINSKEGYAVSLDTQNNDRSYLFGRLLAIADVLERRVLGYGETRPTNAIRYMNSFSQNPERTWKIIRENLQPYQVKLGPKGFYLVSLIDEVSSKFNFDEFSNEPLSGKYLLGFSSQRYDLNQKKTDVVEMNDEGESSDENVGS
jgi:CRISPR-associated protein Csd1